jgi:hypothetical protein
MTIREMTAVMENKYPILQDVLTTLRNLQP